MFLLSTVLRLRQYRSVLSLVVRLRSRWPNLTTLVLAHKHIFLNRDTVLPLVLMLALLVINTFASQFIWPQADLFTLRDILHSWLMVPLLSVTGLAMLIFDIWGTLWVGIIDEKEMEKYFDQAEYWLKDWKAPVVRVLSLGFVNPRQMVAKEVRAALESTSELLNNTLWWVTIQTMLRILFGLCLWGSYLVLHFMEA
jgi:hypothetical protein